MGATPIELPGVRGLSGRDRQRLWVRLASISQYDAKKLARLAGVTVRHLERYFNTDFGRAPQDWLNEQRMVAARYLLMENRSVKSVYLNLAYTHASHFSRAFRRVYEMSPTEFSNRFSPSIPRY